MALELIGDASGVEISDYAKEIEAVEFFAQFVSVEVEDYEIIDEDSLSVRTKATRADKTTQSVELCFTRSVFQGEVYVYFADYYLPKD